MGTRGSVGFIIDNKESLSYNHFDSYPGGLGYEILEKISLINNENGWDKFKESARQLINIEVDKITDEALIEKYKKYANLGVSKQDYSDPYCLFRTLQGTEWLVELYRENLNHYPLNNDFIYDSLFCEYAYIINLDTMKLEFYDGYQKIPQNGNRFGVEHNKDGYYPCRLAGVFDLRSIQESEISNFVNKMDAQADEDSTVDSSVLNYFRKPKLEVLNEKASN